MPIHRHNKQSVRFCIPFLLS